MKNLKIVHTSDTHLGTDWKPELEKKAFRAILNGAIDLDADVVLIVGDVFDHARVADEVLQFFVHQIRTADMPVVVLPGNHDLFGEHSGYHREPFNDAPPNL